jgi:hypothetical protein
MPRLSCILRSRNFSGTRVATIPVVARKYYNAGMMRPVADAAAMNLRTATQLMGMRVPPRVKKVPALRRRLPILMMPAIIEPVIIRHGGQNLGSVVAKTPSLQPQIS